MPETPVSTHSTSLSLGGKVAIGVCIPVLLLGTAILGVFLFSSSRRKRQATDNIAPAPTLPPAPGNVVSDTAEYLGKAAIAQPPYSTPTSSSPVPIKPEGTQSARPEQVMWPGAGVVPVEADSMPVYGMPELEAVSRERGFR
jgi:hypothetical protein